jgi:hypothetical protein
MLFSCKNCKDERYRPRIVGVLSNPLCHTTQVMPVSMRHHFMVCRLNMLLVREA